MGLHRLAIDGREVIFINTWRGTPSGFVHETELYIDGWAATAAKCHYINRTWERYSYQSVMLQAVHNLQQQETEREKQLFRNIMGIRNIMPRHKALLEEHLKTSKTLSIYKKIEEALR
jgi:hypothetical protein